MLMFVGCHLVDWSSKIQIIIIHRTDEAEYVSTDAVKRVVIWLKNMLMAWTEKKVDETATKEDK